MQSFYFNRKAKFKASQMLFIIKVSMRYRNTVIVLNKSQETMKVLEWSFIVLVSKITVIIFDYSL